MALGGAFRSHCPRLCRMRLFSRLSGSLHCHALCALKRRAHGGSPAQRPASLITHLKRFPPLGARARLFAAGKQGKAGFFFLSSAFCPKPPYWAKTLLS
jgi:hypothetical protein